MKVAFILTWWLRFLNEGAYSEFVTTITVTPVRLWSCNMENSKEKIVYQNVKLYKINREQFIDTDLILKIPFDDNLQATVKSSYWTNGGFKNRFSLPIGSLCSGLKTLIPTLFNQFVNATSSKGCPIPPGTVEIRKFIGQTDFSLPASPGRYKSTIIFSKNGVVVGCLNVETTATPAKNKKKS